MEKEKQFKRKRRPVHLTLSEDAVKLLKDTGNTASRVIDRLILDAFTEPQRNQGSDISGIETHLSKLQ